LSWRRRAWRVLEARVEVKEKRVLERVSLLLK